MIFISHGHHSKATKIKKDPGAVGNGHKEGDLTIDFVNRVCKELDKLKVRYIRKTLEESLAMYTNRIKTGSGSVVVEYHFDAAVNPTATGTTSLIESEADRFDRFFAKELAHTTSCVLGIRDRGVLTEAESHRGRLGLMREDGLICLHEICFISNPLDIQKYMLHRDVLAARHAEILVKYEAMF